MFAEGIIALIDNYNAFTKTLTKKTYKTHQKFCFLSKRKATRGQVEPLTRRTGRQNKLLREGIETKLKPLALI